MNRTLIDADSILSEIDQWNKLDTEWGSPVDLETEERELINPEVASFLSTLERKVTFDSAIILKTIREKTVKNVSKDTSTLNYEKFLEDLKKNSSLRNEQPFCFVDRHVHAASSVSTICSKIDAIFRSIEQLCIENTLGSNKKKKERFVLPDVIQCSISTGGLSFDETKESMDKNLDSYIDELFEFFNNTLESLQEMDNSEDIQESVSTLVRKFSTFLCNPVLKCARRKRQCSEKFRELTEFWKMQSCNT